jgi:hypothetical protein
LVLHIKCILLVLEEIFGLQVKFKQHKLIIGGYGVMCCASDFSFLFEKLCEWFDKKGY